MNKKLYIEETAKWICRNKFDLLITLHFKKEVERQKAEKSLDLFLKKLNNDIFGNRSNRTLKQVPFLEKNSFDSSFHIHILCEVPSKLKKSGHFKDPSYFRNIVKKCWYLSAPEAAIKNMKINDDNPIWMKKIENQEGICKYLLKQIAIDNFDVLQVDKLNFNGHWR